MVTMLTTGPAHTLVENETYALPGGKAVSIQVEGSDVEWSNDGTTWNAVTLDDNNKFYGASMFIRATNADTIVVLKS